MVHQARNSTCGRIGVLCVHGAVVLAAACAGGGESPAGSDDSAWRGSTTTEGDTTTVRTESGSVWEGTAELVEEASIGSAAGDEPYLLGDVNGLAATADRIVVIDRQVPVVRVYDLDGNHLLDVGGVGEGPGEFGGGGISGPVGVATDPDGRIYVHDREEIEVFGPDGGYLDTWSIDRAREIDVFDIVATGPGAVLVADYLPSEERAFWNRDVGLRAVHEGEAAAELRPLPDLGYETPRVEVEMSGGNGMMAFVPPFVPQLAWAVGPAGDVVIGRPDRYEIERHRPDGSRTVISRHWAPVPVEADEGEWYLRRARLQATRQPGTIRGYDLDGGLPGHKPAFEQVVPGHDGGLWVVRAGPGERLEGCAEDAEDLREINADPCWRDTYLFDVFGADGRYLGDVRVPDVFMNERYQKFEPQPYVDGDSLVAQVEDGAGTIMVKRWRLVPPGEDGPPAQAGRGGS